MHHKKTSKQVRLTYIRLEVFLVFFLLVQLQEHFSECSDSIQEATKEKPPRSHNNILLSILI